MTERRMPQVMRQANSFDQLFVQAQLTRHCSGDLRHFQRVRQARPVQVTFVVNKYLGFINQAPECRGVDDAIPVPLKFTPIGM
jgi:hypothetical protein